MTRLLLLAAMAIVAVLAAAGVGAGAEWDVYPGESIQGAIDGAGAGDTIYVHAGTYVENVDVDKRVTLIGGGADVVTVLAGDVGDHVFEVTADWVNITGFTVTGTTGSWDDGIYLDRVNYCNISDNNASNNFGGISLRYSNNNTLTNNTANSNDMYGIRLHPSSNNNTLMNNNASSNKYGIYMGDSSNNTLVSNTANSNDLSGISLVASSNNVFTNNILVNDGFCISDSYRNTLKNNTVNGKPLAYLEDISNFTIQNAGQVILVNCTNVTAENLNLSNASIGIHLWKTNDCKISNNTISNNLYGIYMGDSSNNILTNITAKSNDMSGIHMRDSSNDNTITNNTFIDNGLLVIDSHRNTVKNNTVNDKPLVYLEDISNFTIQNAGQVILVNCINITVENLNLSDTDIGVELLETNDCKIVNNIANSNNYYGIWLLYSSNNALRNNNASGNGADGIYLYQSNNNTLTNNIASNNYYGIHLQLSSTNTIHHNNLIDNAWYNAYDKGTNTWDSGAEGNYYSDYTGTDANRDGIGDDPYSIPGDTSTDRFPLMHPWTAAPQKGDLNSDGNVTPADAAIALRIAASGAHDDAADVSGDGCVTSLDALMILQAAGGRIEL